MSANTIFASTGNFTKGGVEITGKDEPSHYLFSNMFDVASKAIPWERIVIAKNLEFTIECVRAEGDSPWFVCAHDETALLVQGAVTTRFIKPSDSGLVPGADKEGAVSLGKSVTGDNMGHVNATRGHLILLPAGAAYQFQAASLSVLLIQSVVGELSIEKWGEICQH